MVTAPGIYQISAGEYHADPAPAPSLSSGIADTLISRSPLHAFLTHARLNPNYIEAFDSKFDFGTAAHDALLEGGTAKICVLNPEDYRSKPTKADPDGAIPKGFTNNAIREARDLARANGLVPILPWDNAKLRTMVEVAQDFIADSELKGVWQQGKPEQTCIWQEPTLRGDIWCRSRMDWSTDDHRIGLDYKTTTDASPEAFIRQIARMNYDFQAAFYTRGLECYTGRRPAWVFLAQEVEAPYSCSLVGLSNAYLEIAAAKVRRAIELWGECLASGNWPAYDNRIHYAEPPSWAVREHEERTVAAEIESGSWQSEE